MYGRRSQLPNLKCINFELEKIFRRHKHVAIKDKIEMDLLQPAPHERPFKNYFSPLVNLSTSCIRYPNVVVMSFELKFSVLNCLPTFYDLEIEDPYNHLNDFHAICQTFNYENFSDDNIKLRLFPFSLKDRARSRFNTLSANSITSWEQMVTKFLNKYFPVHKINDIHKVISEFN